MFPSCTPHANGYFLTAVSFDGKSDSCPWDCNAGYEMIGSVCTGCLAGTVMLASAKRTLESAIPNQCAACRECDYTTQYKFANCTASVDTVCKPCSSNVCSSGQYLSQPCSRNSDRVCSACVSKCNAGYFMTRITCSGSTTTDEVAAGCMKCVTRDQCPAGTYLPSLCTGSETQSFQCVKCTVRLLFFYGCSTLAE